MSIYRKLKDYICKTDSGETYIFGDLLSLDCEYLYEEDGESKTYRGQGMMWKDDPIQKLYEYYVVSISPKFKLGGLDNSTIMPYLEIVLRDNVDYEEKVLKIK